MKEKYLQSIKNAMFWHFSSEEIRDALEDANSYYESALENGIHEEKIIEEYGTPKVIAKVMREEGKGECRKALLAKELLLFGCVFLIFLSFSLAKLDIAVNLSVVFCSVLIWFASGNDCMIQMVTWDREKRRVFIGSQCFLVLLYCGIQVWASVIYPHMMGTNMEQQINALAKGITLGVYFLIVGGFLFVVFSCIKMLQGNIYMYFCMIQGVALIGGIVLYYDFLKKSTDTSNLGYVFVTYFISILALIPYGIYFFKKRRINIGCSD